MPGGIPDGLVRDLAPLGRVVRASMPELARRALGDPAAVSSILKRFDAALKRAWPDRRIDATFEKRGVEVKRRTDREWAPLERAVARKQDAFGQRFDQGEIPDGVKLLDRWSTSAAGRISSVRDDIVPGLRADILHAIENDWTPDQLAGVWKERDIPLKFGTLEGRTQVIANNQIRTLQVAMQSERSVALGIEEWTWRTVGDSDVREEHMALADQTFKHGSPPSEGRPGEPVNCRCHMESVITSGFLAEQGLSL